MILDCTLRDGGYYVDWDFDEGAVTKYLSAVITAKIDILEVGFRFLPTNKFLGAFAYSTDEYLRTINIPNNIPVAVMVNASEIINAEGGIRETIGQLFVKEFDSPVNIVRIAIRAEDVDGSYEIVDELSCLGYRVFLNLMQVGDISNDRLVDISRMIASWNIIEVLYFADSFGSMDPDAVKKVVECLSIGWSGKLGFHAHDNKGLALPNTLKAQECGVEYLDATLCGMGRGAGNTKTEYLLVEMVQRNLGEYFPDALFPLVLQEFGDMQEKYGWGENIYYFLSAIYGIHPTYIQEMLSGELYDTEQILSAINFLKNSKESFYSFEKMLSAIVGIEGNQSGTWSAAGWAKDKDVLILAPGPELQRHIKVIRSYIKKNQNLVVLCLNVNKHVPEDMVTAYVACHETRILIEADSYSHLGVPIILPLDRIPISIKKSLDNINLLDFGLSIKQRLFQVNDKGCILGNSLSLFYAIAVATASNANRIFIAGADGYEVSDPRYNEVSSLFEQYSAIDNALPICAITKTTYPIVQRSIYDPNI